MESGTTTLESLTSLENSPDTAQLSTTPQPIKGVTTTEKALPIPRQPTTADIVPSSTVASKNSIVTGTDGAVATYIPEQNKDYISFTGTTTTTDDSGAAIVIFPFGWFWKLDSGKVGGGIAKVPAPTANPIPVKEPGNENEDDDDASTKENENSTMVSTVLSTTQEPTSVSTAEETTTSEECTVATQPDCTRTVSYMTSDGTQTM
jgi:hypothetical protein